MTDDVELDIPIEGDASTLIRASNDAAGAILKIFQQVQALQTQLDTLFSGTLPKGMRQLQTLAGHLNTLDRTTQTIARANQLGGQSGVARAANTSGVIRGLRDDPVRQALQVETETNKALEARLQIYRRLKAANPNADDAKLLRAYQASMAQLDPNLRRTRNNQGRFEENTKRREFLQQSVAQQAQFNKIMLEENEAAYQADLRNFENTLRQKARVLATYEGEQRRVQRDAYLNRAFSQTPTGRRIRPEDQQRLGGYLDEQIGTAEANFIPRAPRPRTTLSPQERARALAESRVESRRAQFEYMGGAPTLLAEGHTLANYALIGGAIGGAAETVKQLVDLQEELKAIQAASGATDQQMNKLSEQILAVGASSNKSLKDLTEATTVLVRAGYSADQLGGALKVVAQTATATHSEVKDVAQATSDVVDTFRMSTSETGQIEAIITNLAVKSKISVEDLGKAVKTSGQFAAGSGVSFREYTAAMAAMAASGMHDGTQLGQGLRQLIESLDNPSKKMLETLQKVGLTTDDINVRTQGLAGAMENLRSHGLNSAEAMSVFNVRTYAAYNALSQNLGVMQRSEKTLDDTSTLTKAAAANMDTLASAWQRLSNSFTQAASEAFGPLLRTLQGVMLGGSQLIGVLGQLGPLLGTVGTLLSTVAAANIIVWLGKMIVGFASMIKNSEGLAAALAALSAVMKGDLVGAMAGLEAALGPVGWVALGLTAIVGLFEAFRIGAGQSAAAVQKFGDAAQQSANHAQEYGEKIKALNDFSETLADRTGHAGDLAEQAASRFSKWGLSLDSTKMSAEQLAGAIANLTAKMQAQQAIALRAQASDLDKKASALQPQIDKARQPLREDAYGILQNRPDLVHTLGSDLVRKMQSPQALTAQDINTIQAKLAFTPQTGFVGSLLSHLSVYASPASEAESARQQATQARSDAGLASTMSSPQYQQARAQARAELEKARQAQLAAMRLPRGAAQAKALADARAQADAAVKSITTQGSSLGSALNQMPELDSLRSLSNNPGSSKTALRSHLSSLMAQWRNTKDPKLEQQIINAAIAERGTTDPAEIQDIQDQYQAQFDQAHQRAGTKAQHERGTTERDTAADIKQKITDYANTAAYTPDSQAKEQADLNGLLNQYHAASVSELKDTKSGADLKIELDKFEKSFADYKQKVLLGDLEGMQKILAEQAKEHADRVKGQQLTSLAAGETDLPTAMAAIQQTAAAALQAQIDELTTASKAAHGGSVTPDTLKKIQDARDKSATEILKSQLEAITESLKGQQLVAKRNFDQRQGGIRQQQAINASYGNIANEGIIGGVHAFQLQQANRLLDVQLASGAVDHAEGELNRANTAQVQRIANKPAADAPEATQKEWLDAVQKGQTELKQLSEQLTNARNEYAKLTSVIQPLTSAQGAVNAAWEKFSHDAQLNTPFYEQLADGLDNAFNRSEQGFSRFLTQVESGTGKIKNYFRDMVVSVLQAIQQMANEMIAKKVFSWLSNFIPGGGGGFNPGQLGTTLPDNISLPAFIGQARGGPVLHMAAGGQVPFDMGGFNQDSVPTMLMPGEFVFNKTATDYIGADNLAAMNFAGNGRASSMPKLAAPVSPQQMMTNVWVVSPESKPQLGPNDVLHVVQSDLLANGQTKQLVKAIALGNF